VTAIPTSSPLVLLAPFGEESLDLTEFQDDFIRRVIEQVTVVDKDRIQVRFVGGFEVEGRVES
jgi:hypothetical protein